VQIKEKVVIGHGHNSKNPSFSRAAATVVDRPSLSTEQPACIDSS
jgi:hypothetical protein